MRSWWVYLPNWKVRNLTLSTKVCLEDLSDNHVEHILVLHLNLIFFPELKKEKKNSRMKFSLFILCKANLIFSSSLASLNVSSEQYWIIFGQRSEYKLFYSNQKQKQKFRSWNFDVRFRWNFLLQSEFWLNHN
jgi:hypothetical protein